MPAPRPLGPLYDPIASDVSYSAATIAVGRAQAGRPGPVPATQLAGVAVAAAAPFLARDLLEQLDDAPWWRRGRLHYLLLTEARARIAEQRVIG